MNHLSFIINVIDEIDEIYGNVVEYPKKSLPQQFILKTNMLVELYVGNYSIKDGLVNGIDGFFKIYTTSNKGDVIWIEFNEKTIGKIQSNKFQHLYTPTIFKQWVPILRITKLMSQKKNQSHVKVGKQFPIQLACA